MRELEVRLALVCFGGASLAVYMNGVSHEILKLVRASKVYHSLSPGRKADPNVSYRDCAGPLDYGTDTEADYFDLLRAVGHTLDVRVVVDVISGASAGGINGIFLARALAFDLDFDPLREMWMRHGDIEQLMEQETLAERWSKIYMYPLIWMFGDRIWSGEKPHEEARRKLSRFLRSRWFKPPFSGTRMLRWMIDANRNMGTAIPGKSLLPTGHQLDLFVSLTNFYGQKQTVTMHDPQRIAEQQHKVTLAFHHRQGRTKPRFSDFDDGNIAGLGFAARATSSFPGAFPPMRLKDLTQFLAKEGLNWDHENQFMDSNFGSLDETASEIEDMCFIDGGVTNNKPFASAIKAIEEKPAHREVDRRVIFVDPRPDMPEEGVPEADSPDTKPVPGFFRTILSSLAAIPRDEPILEDLREIEDRNKEARRFEAVMRRIDMDVAALVDRIIVLEPGQPVSTAMLASWRERAHEQAHQEAGFVYGSYTETKAVQMVERLGDFINHTRKRDKTDAGVNMAAGLQNWAKELGYIESGDTTNRSAIPFFRAFDVDFRVRRLRFVIKQLNRYLQDAPGSTDHSSYVALKAQVYDFISCYRQSWQADIYNSINFDAPLPEIMQAIANIMNLESVDFDVDKVMAQEINSITDEALKAMLFRTYVGFAFYDVLTLPMTAHMDLLEIDEVRVDRISPLDCDMLHKDGKSPLMGDKLYNFGAFFSRKARENDYIWGRIHAANRLVDFLCSAVGSENLNPDFDVEALRRRLIMNIADTEAKHTRHSADLIARLKKDYGP